MFNTNAKLNEVVNVSECRYCDSTAVGHPYGPEETPVCLSCGAEWDPVVVAYLVEDFEFDLEDDQE